MTPLQLLQKLLAFATATVVVVKLLNTPWELFNVARISDKAAMSVCVFCCCASCAPPTLGKTSKLLTRTNTNSIISTGRLLLDASVATRHFQLFFCFSLLIYCALPRPVCVCLSLQILVCAASSPSPTPPSVNIIIARKKSKPF